MTNAEEPKRFGLENQVKRNPHKDFKKVEASRKPFDKDKRWEYSKTIDPDWRVGDGANESDWKQYKKLEIDPFGDTRDPVDNYKLLISAVTPRPIGFTSTVGKDGTKNLAPFSYFTVVNHDPPIFCIGLSGGKGNPKDSCRNLLETEECTINIISEWFLEAANYTCTNCPYEVNEWDLSGLTPLKSTKVKPDHVAESAFSIEGKLIHSHEWKSKKDPNKATGTLCIIEGVNFHVMDNVVNKDLNNIDIASLRPVSRLGGITYGRTVDGFELPRPLYDPSDIPHK
ncbi:uncharacterized protein PRCAT00000013001 [Priceomyces carsonii]|uniref:uncharacterized protein n=1 Tax=Priceomyces carsonii TaxID=28549 RepID=UPI002ED94780|nr:unnamed protein product [Priceomyces carsonii]